MQQPDDIIREAVAWMQAEGVRHALIAREHIAMANTLAARQPTNPVRIQAYRRCAQAAAHTALRFVDWAMAISSLRPIGGPLAAGAATYLPATFLRRCAAEDFPGQGLFRLAGGEVVRAPLASQAAEAPAQQDRWAG